MRSRFGAQAARGWHTFRGASRMRNFASGSSHVDLQDDLRKQIVSAGSASGAGRRGSALAAPSATPVRCYLKINTLK